MQFRKYNSIENTTNKILLDFKMSELYHQNDIWVVTQKVDGGNFSWQLTQDNQVKPGKRTSFVNWNQNFFNSTSVYERYGIDEDNKIFKLLLHIKSKYDNCKVVIVYGQMCGGNYDGLKSTPQTKRIQNRVKYSNQNQFIAFDILIIFNDNAQMYLSHHEVYNMCNKYGIPVVQIQFQGTLTQALEWSNYHNQDNSIVWKMFNMPHQIDGNIREGNVIKPLNTIFKGCSRIIFKDKNSKFDQHKKGKEKNAKPKIEYCDQFVELVQISIDMICENRFRSVISKFGEYSIKDFGTLLNLFFEDIEDQIHREQDYDRLYESLSDIEIKQFRKTITREISKFMGSNKQILF